MTITLKVTDKTKEKMIKYFEDLKKPITPNYAIFQAVDGDSVVTLYESGKCVFQGRDADLASQFWIETEKLNSGKAITTNSEEKKKDKNNFIDPKIYNSTSIGSDEVGTGDYFGPIVVTASYVKATDIPYLESLGIKDSKKMTDEKILEVVPKIKDKIKYSTIILSNKEYNEKYKNGYNMNKIKAILHNKALSNLKNEGLNYDYIVVDQFAEKYVYFSYLKETNNVVKDITFLTKGEDKCLAVACSSIISRYIFLKEFSSLSKSVGILLPKGASLKVDEVGVKIVNQYGFDKLNEIAKLNFKNTEKIKELLN
jgi:ribonuclease HIII